MEGIETMRRKTYTFSIVLAVLASLLPFSQSLRAQVVAGAIEGTAGAGGLGGATYTIPIQVPEGLGGMQPSLAVAYNSQGGNGLLGWCWDLQGLSAVTRIGTTLYHDGAMSGVDFDDDRFALDGQRLVCVSGTYGANNAEYRTEADAMAKIVSYTCDTTSGPAWFKVWLPNGNIAYYGQTRDSRIGLQQRNDVCLWLLNRMEDRNGNYVEYNYDRGGASYRIDYIRYGGNALANIPCCYIVRFFYSERDDTEISFIGDNSLNSSRLLDSILVKRGSNVLHKYRFEYHAPNCSNGYYYTRLKQVDFSCGSESYNPTVIQWGTNDYGSYGSSQCHGISVTGGSSSDFDGKVKFTGDLNGDGYTDVIVYEPGRSGNKTAVIYINQGLSSNGNLNFSKLSTTITLDDDIDWIYTSDLNGDGLDDIILSNRKRTFIGKDKLTLAAYLSSTEADGTFHITAAQQSFGEFWIRKKYKEAILVGDFLGEGKQSFLLQEFDNSKSSPRLFYFTYSNGILSSTQLPQDMVLDADKMFACDFNGDGISEIYFMNEDGPSTGLLRMRRSGSSYSYQTVNSNMLSAWHQLFPGDFNGDGKADLLSYVEDSNHNPSWQIHLFKESSLKWPAFHFNVDTMGIGNPATHFNSLQQFDNPSYKFITVGDFNGDGKADVAVRTDGNCLRFLYGPVRLENGQGVFASIQTVSLNDIGLSGVTNQTICTGNFLGHENMNVFSASTVYALNPFTNRYSVTRITDGMGNRTLFEYEYLMAKPSGASGTDFYTRAPQTGNEQAAHMYTVSLPMKGLSRMSTHNTNCDAPMTEVRYRYGDALLHRQGRGFLGFKSTATEEWIDSERWQTVERESETMFLVPSLVPKTERVKRSDGTVVSTTVNENGVLFRRDPTSGNVGKVFVPVVRRQTTLERDVENPQQLLRKTIAQYGYNDSTAFTVDLGSVKVYDILKQTQASRGVDPSDTVSAVAHCEFQTLTQTTYLSESTGDLQDWIVNRPYSVLTTSRRLGGYDDIKSLVVNRYPNSGSNPFLPFRVENFPGGVESNLDTLATFEYRAYHATGAVEVRIVRDMTGRLPVRRWSYAFSNDGRFVTRLIDPAGDTTQYAHHPDYGYLTSETDCNGLVNSYSRTPLGSSFTTTRPDGSVTQGGTMVGVIDPYAPAGCHYWQWSTTSGSGETHTYYNALGQKLRTLTQGMDGEIILKDFDYNERGLLAMESLPYFYGSQVKPRIRYYYDDYDRPFETVYPDGMVETTLYDGLTTLHVKTGLDPDDPPFTSTTVNAAEWTVRSADEEGNVVVFDHYADGKLKTTRLGNDTGTTVSVGYDAAGNRVTLTDPNYGTVTSVYDAYGQLVSTTNPTGEATTYEYDVPGRMVKRREHNRLGNSTDSTVWVYSTTPGTWGLLERISFNGKEQEIRYFYDSLCRVTTVSEMRSYDYYLTHYTYDTLSRVTAVTYPTGFTMRKGYTATGHLSTLRDGDGNLLWETEEKNALGQVTRYSTGDGVTTQRKYDPSSGRLKGILSYDSNDTIQNLWYVYEINGNLAFRTDSIRDMEERFTYDRLDRLTGIVEGLDTTGVFTYDDYGRMTSKYLHGALGFNATVYGAGGRPHAISKANMHPDEPNMTMAYTSFDKLQNVSLANRSLSYGYGYEHQRLRMAETVGNNTVKTKEYADHCEFVVEDDGAYCVKYNLTYLSGPLGVFAVRDTRMLPESKRMYYVHPDHLGSWTTVTSWNGTVVQDVRFEPWGTAYDVSSGTPTQANSLIFDRGFTGHEHLMGFRLINMNGRMYDPVMSCFLSVDNYVQDPSYTQNFNRYAYCMNNPLKYTDPDGEWAHLVIGALIGGIVNLNSNWGRINTFGEGLAYFGIGAAAGAIGTVVGGAAAGAMKLGGFISGAVSGAAGGASSGMITGSGNAWMQGATFGQGLKAGAIAAGIGAGTGTLLGGLTRGVIDYRKGFDFWDGTRIDEFIDGTVSTEWDDFTDQYNSSQRADYDTEFLKDRVNDSFGVSEGDYNINKITTRSSPGYKITDTGKYVNTENNKVVGGYCRSFSSGYSEIHISPYTTNLDAINFKAVVGHELIHAYHHYTIPSSSFNRTYSERVAYRYTRNIYLQNGQFSKAVKVMTTALKLNYWGNAPMNYSFHPF